MTTTIDTSMRGVVRTPTLLLMHILAGKSILTIRSRKSGERMTFRFSMPDDERNNEYAARNYSQEGVHQGRPIWVSLYGGPEGDFTAEGNERRNWTFLGTMRRGARDGEPFSYRRSAKSKLFDDHVAQRFCHWVAENLPQHADVLMERGEWWHEGVCGRCGRRLTVPDSIETGFGPECRKAVGL